MFSLQFDNDKFSKSLLSQIKRKMNQSVQKTLMYAEVYLGGRQDAYLEQFAYQLFDQMDSSYENSPETIRRKIWNNAPLTDVPFYEFGGLKRNILFKFDKQKGTTKGTIEVAFKDEYAQDQRGKRHRDIFMILDMGSTVSDTGVWIPPRPVMNEAMNSMGMNVSKVQDEQDENKQIYAQSESRYFTRQSPITQYYSESQSSISQSKNLEVHLEGQMIEEGLNEWVFEIIPS